MTMLPLLALMACTGPVATDDDTDATSVPDPDTDIAVWPCVDGFLAHPKTRATSVVGRVMLLADSDGDGHSDVTTGMRIDSDPMDFEEVAVWYGCAP